jgi:hypothetical protein
MAVMSSRKQAVKTRWEAINRQREQANKLQKENTEEKISEEEHDKRVEMLKQMGLLK